MRLADGLEILQIEASSMGRATTVFPTLIWDEDTVILVDAGHAGCLQKFRDAVADAGVSFNRINKVIVTHQDLDHTGNLPEIRSQLKQQAEFLAHAEEKPYIQGDRPLIKSKPEELAKRSTQFSSLTEEQRKAVISALQNPPKTGIDRTVADGEELPYCGGIIVIHTPGHTPGHISLYHKPSKTLITGDAMVVGEGRLLGPVPIFTENMELAVKSLEKLAQLDIKNVICYHGGLYQDNPNRRIAELAGS